VYSLGPDVYTAWSTTMVTPGQVTKSKCSNWSGTRGSRCHSVSEFVSSEARYNPLCAALSGCADGGGRLIGFIGRLSWYWNLRVRRKKIFSTKRNSPKCPKRPLKPMNPIYTRVLGHVVRGVTPPVAGTWPRVRASSGDCGPWTIHRARTASKATPRSVVKVLASVGTPAVPRLARQQVGVPWHVNPSHTSNVIRRRAQKHATLASIRVGR
jgi:hypothetical protein